MAEAKRPIFNKKASERLNSPDDLDKYVRVTNPSVWLVLVGCIVLLIGLLSWGMFGFAETHEQTLGCVADGRALCFMSTKRSLGINEGDPAVVEGRRMSVATVSDQPLPADQVAQIVGSEYLAETLVTDRWVYLIAFKGDVSGLTEGIPLSIDITTDSVTPISLILGR